MLRKSFIICYKRGGGRRRGEGTGEGKEGYMSGVQVPGR